MTEQELVNEIIKLASELDRGDITPDDITIKAENLVRTDRYDQLTDSYTHLTLPTIYSV